MTTKQAADIIRMLLGYLKGEIEPPKQETIEEARSFEQQGYECLEMAIKALEQQPCEDAVSRQAVIEITAETGALETQSRVRELPSVTPKEKTGKWIVHPKGIYAHLVCNKCLSSAPYDCRTNYCPNCGARMVSE